MENKNEEKKPKENKNPLEGKNPLEDLLKKINDIFGGKIYIPIAIGAVVLILVVVAILGLVSGGSDTSSETVTPGMLTAAIVVGEDRYCYHNDEGLLVGIEPELAQQYADVQGLTLKVIEAETQAEAVALLDTKAADVALGRLTSQLGLAGYNISEDYGHSGLFMVSVLHDYTDSLNLMTGYSVGVMNTVNAVAGGLPNYDYVSVKDYDNAVTLGEDIRDRNVSLGVVNERDAISLVKSFPNALQVQEISDGPSEYYVAVLPHGKAAAVTLMNGVINSAGSIGE
ncbi:MAG: transporter substrate-binding domain-containing protein [Butyrivibrio sp.]|nr:transporter substrate-binding domain-containing protein [Butyrivibrio sp.]